jgi:paraquat-inducible protein B
MGQDAFVGLEQVPVTPLGTPGLHVTLVGKGDRSLSSGDPVLYHGFTVGRVEEVEFNTSDREAYYQLFIRAPYNDFVTTHTRFWNVSGLNVRTSTSGIQLDAGSLESILVGGVAFAVPDGMSLGEPVSGRAEFRLYPDRHQINERAFEHYLEYVLLSDASVRGLEAGAPVEYRGVRVGTVLSANLPYTDDTNALDETSIPVLIRVEPGRMGLSDDPQAVAEVRERVPELVRQRGLRATLKAGNLFTGSLYVDLNFYPDAQPASLKTFRQYPVLPTVSSGFAQLEARLDAVLQKLQKLPVEPILKDVSGVLIETQKTLQGMRSTLDGLEKLLAQESLQTIPASLNASLEELTQALRGFSADSPLYRDVDRSLEKLQDLIWDLQPLVKALSNKPNSLLFGGPQAADPEPQGRKR